MKMYAVAETVFKVHLEVTGNTRFLMDLITVLFSIIFISARKSMTITLAVAVSITGARLCCKISVHSGPSV